MEININSETDYQEKIPAILKKANGRKIWLFTGDLGAGKTTLIKSILEYLESQDLVTSPSFSLVNEYEYPEGKVYHMDLYRIKDLDEALAIGLEEYLSSESYCFIEWPEIAAPVFNEGDFKIHIKILDLNRRKIILQ